MGLSSLLAFLVGRPIEITSPVNVLLVQADTGKPATKAWVYQETEAQAAQKVYGYRIQVFATVYKDKAYRIKAKLQEQVDFPVYVEEIPPFYKIRVGDFKSKEEAEKFLPVIRNLGYPDAFIAETVINAPAEGEQ